MLGSFHEKKKSSSSYQKILIKLHQLILKPYMYVTHVGLFSWKKKKKKKERKEKKKRIGPLGDLKIMWATEANF